MNIFDSLKEAIATRASLQLTRPIRYAHELATSCGFELYSANLATLYYWSDRTTI